MSTYERVTFRPEGGRARTIYLHMPRVTTHGELGDILTGLEVTREGDDVLRAGERRHVISLALVSRRTPMMMDNTYGELVEA